MPIFVKPGFEADDLIATMTKRLEGQGFEVFLVSKDKDLRQLLDDATKMYDVQADEVIDAAAMSQVRLHALEAVEVQTLTGDATDSQRHPRHRRKNRGQAGEKIRLGRGGFAASR